MNENEPSDIDLRLLINKKVLSALGGCLGPVFITFKHTGDITDLKTPKSIFKYSVPIGRP